MSTTFQFWTILTVWIPIGARPQGHWLLESLFAFKISIHWPKVTSTNVGSIGGTFELVCLYFHLSRIFTGSNADFLRINWNLIHSRIIAWNKVFLRPKWARF